MVLTDRQRNDLHAGIYEYLKSRPGEAFQRAAQALYDADSQACDKVVNGNSNKTPLLEKKWTAIPRLQKKVLELERVAAQSAKIHAHRVGSGGAGADVGQRRMLPRLPAQHKLQGHSAVVTTVALHPVFTVVASGSEDGTIKVRECSQNGLWRCVLTCVLLPHSSRLEFSHAAIFCCCVQSQVWDHESGDYMRTLKGHTNTVNSVCFTPKGTHLASCSTDLSIKLWDFTTYACLRTLRGHDHTISSVCFLPSPELSGNNSTTTTTTGMAAAVAGCQHLLSASRDTTVKMWDVETGFCDQTFSNHTDWVRCLAVRPSDGGLWASGGNDQTIYVYDASSGKSNVAVELRGHEHVINALAFVKEEPLKQKTATRETKHSETIRDYLASASRDRTVRLWKISEANCLAIFRAHQNWVQSVLIHPSGNYVISCGDDKSIRVFDVKAQRCLRTLDRAHDHFVTSLDMHPTLPVLVSGSVDQTIRCWQLD